MNPVVLIATHERLHITTLNIKNILTQSIVPKIILVVSDPNEAHIYKREFGGSIQLVRRSNWPLGAKWQAGVDMSRSLKADPLIITGSDDILGVKFIELALEGIEYGYEFLGLKRWYIYKPESDTAFYFEYKNLMPLGGGRVYSKKMLERINYNLFEIDKHKHLDDRGWFNITRAGLSYSCETETSGLEILAVKGEWPTMNPFEKTIDHPNAGLIDIIQRPHRLLKEKFNYVI